MLIGFPKTEALRNATEWGDPNVYAADRFSTDTFGACLHPEKVVTIDLRPHMEFIRNLVASDTHEIRRRILNQALAFTMDPFLQLSAAIRTSLVKTDGKFNRDDAHYRRVDQAKGLIGKTPYQCTEERGTRERYLTDIPFAGATLANWKELKGDLTISNVVLEMEKLWGVLAPQTPRDMYKKIYGYTVPFLVNGASPKWLNQYCKHRKSFPVGNKFTDGSNPSHDTNSAMDAFFRTNMFYHTGDTGNRDTDAFGGNPENPFTLRSYQKTCFQSAPAVYQASAVLPTSVKMLAVSPGEEQLIDDYNDYANNYTFVSKLSPLRHGGIMNASDVVESFLYVDMNLAKYMLSSPSFIGSAKDFMTSDAIKLAIYLEYIDDAPDGTSGFSALDGLISKTGQFCIPLYNNTWVHNHYDVTYFDNSYVNIAREHKNQLDNGTDFMHGGKLWNYEDAYSLQAMKRL